MMVVNELKTKVMVFGKKDDKPIIFNGMVIQNAEVYKYLGNIIRPTTICSGDILKENSRLLCDKARKAIFGIFKKLTNIGAPTAQTNAVYFRHTNKTHIAIWQWCMGRVTERK